MFPGITPLLTTHPLLGELFELLEGPDQYVSHPDKTPTPRTGKLCQPETFPPPLVELFLLHREELLNLSMQR